MDTSLLQALLRTSDEAELQTLIQTHSLNIQTVEALKARAADLHFSQPDEALQLAQTAHRLGNLLPPPALALGCWVLGNALLFSDRYQEAVHYLGQAQSLYLDAGLPLEAARAGVGHVGVLAYTGAFEEALTSWPRRFRRLKECILLHTTVAGTVRRMMSPASQDHGPHPSG